MNNQYITNINIEKVRHLSSISIPINENKRTHLVLTGGNGSGKTSLLEAIKRKLTNISSLESLEKSEQQQQTAIEQYKKSISDIHKARDEEVSIKFNVLKGLLDAYNASDYLIVFFPAKRSNKMDVPKGPQKLNTRNTRKPEESMNEQFLQYLVNLKTEKSFALTENNDENAAKQIDKWFGRFEDMLKKIFIDDELRLEFDFKNYNFNIFTKDHELFTLNQLSDGYAAIINIITEIIFRMEGGAIPSPYDIPGIVLIDEIETHLHIELQKIIFPFLTSFFPNIQFIITTHSPFVLSSVSNAVIFDLEHKERVEDLSAYSYESIVENYFDADQYSSIIKDKMIRFETLLAMKKRNKSDKEEYESLHNYLIHIDPQLAPELADRVGELRVRYGADSV